MGLNTYDDVPEGQMELADLLDSQEKLVAVSRVFARSRREMGLAEQKTFVFALTQLRFLEEPKSDTVYVDKKSLAKVVGISLDDVDNLSANLRRAVGELPKHSFIQIADQDKDLYINGCVITSIAFFRNRVRIRFNSDYLSLFTGMSRDYITLWADDIFSLNEKRSVQFYEYLRQITDARKTDNVTHISTKALKELFGIPFEGKGSYVRPNGAFARSEFEKRVLDPICADLAKTRMITLSVYQDGKGYKKIKKGGEVVSYEFAWTFTPYPRVVSSVEQSQIEKNPQALKIAKDILNGKAKAKAKPKKNSFNDFPQRKYDYEELEKRLLGIKK